MKVPGRLRTAAIVSPRVVGCRDTSSSTDKTNSCSILAACTPAPTMSTSTAATHVSQRSPRFAWAGELLEIECSCCCLPGADLYAGLYVVDLLAVGARRTGNDDPCILAFRIGCQLGSRLECRVLAAVHHEEILQAAGCIIQVEYSVNSPLKISPASRRVWSNTLVESASLRSRLSFVSSQASCKHICYAKKLINKHPPYSWASCDSQFRKLCLLQPFTGRMTVTPGHCCGQQMTERVATSKAATSNSINTATLREYCKSGLPSGALW